MKFVLDYDRSLYKVFAKSGVLVYECDDDEKFYSFIDFLQRYAHGQEAGMNGVDDDD